MTKRIVIWNATDSDPKPLPDELFLVLYDDDDGKRRFAMAQYYEGEFYFNDYSNNESIKQEDLLMPNQPTHWAWDIGSPV
jgi:hypothetical protein